MAKPDISSLSFSELDELKKEIEKQKKTVEQENRKKATDEIKAVAAKYGISLSDLFGGALKATRKPAAPKYRNPKKSSETWSGRGKPPAWLLKLEEEGGKRENFLIKK